MRFNDFFLWMRSYLEDKVRVSPNPKPNPNPNPNPNLRQAASERRRHRIGEQRR